jgi:hypothetical protein
MIVEQKLWTAQEGWKIITSTSPMQNAQLVIAFGDRDLLKDPKKIQEMKSFYPSAQFVFGSTAGEIIGTHVYDNSLVVNAISFEKTQMKLVQSPISDPLQSQSAGEALADQLDPVGLKHVLVISDGLKVNGTSLVAGLKNKLPAAVSVTGGLVGDNAAFKETVVGINDTAQSGLIVGIGLYGNIQIGYGSFGGWDSFGLDRLITKSKDNVLFELDGKPALSLYKEYLGEKAKELPGSGLLFPLSMKVKKGDGTIEEVVRTLLSVNETDQSMTFAGDMPTGTVVRLMKANFDRLIDGAGKAASLSIQKLNEQKPDFALLISCVGRKLILKERTEEEIEAVQTVFGPKTALSGFYSYGEICPGKPTDTECTLHNQTMTITTFKEG